MRDPKSVSVALYGIAGASGVQSWKHTGRIARFSFQQRSVTQAGKAMSCVLNNGQRAGHSEKTMTAKGQILLEAMQ